MLRRIAILTALVAFCSSAAYAVGLVRADRLPWQQADAATAPTPTPTPTPEPTPTPTPSITSTPKPTPTPAPALLAPGDDGPEVKALQARLTQIAWFSGAPTGHYGDQTEEAVRGFQAKRGIPVTGEVDRRTMRRLLAMTTEPTAAQLDADPLNNNTPGALDPRCETGRAICVDKTSSTVRWVVDGVVRKTLDARFGASYSPTREGLFHVYFKSRDHVSKLYGSSMPFAMFFSGGQAVHYSSDFAARGYSGASHGCVNIRDEAGVAWLFDQVRVGDAVVVYRS
ncbi:MAG TPA: L,D-transpeptidase family protein [Nocardioides sp.]|nr:L,D-transpeptidase family protein [Nocardioides sp.]